MRHTNTKITDVAQRTNLNKSTISNLLNARQKTITLDNLNRIVDALDCDLYIELRPKDKGKNKKNTTVGKSGGKNKIDKIDLDTWIDL